MPTTETSTDMITFRMGEWPKGLSFADRNQLRRGRISQTRPATNDRLAPNVTTNGSGGDTPKRSPISYRKLDEDTETLLHPDFRGFVEEDGGDEHVFRERQALGLPTRLTPSERAFLALLALQNIKALRDSQQPESPIHEGPPTTPALPAPATEARDTSPPVQTPKRSLRSITRLFYR